MPDITCIMVLPTDKARYWLRRYRKDYQARCPAGPNDWGGLGCDAKHLLGDYPYDLVEMDGKPGSHTRYIAPRADLEPPPGNLLWPEACATCYEPFATTDNYQLYYDVVYRNAEQPDQTWPLREVPEGAMWNAWWFAGFNDWVGPDGMSLVVKLPGGFDWCMDQPSTSGTPWQRTGTPPKITANPSIGVPLKSGGFAYHGWLRDGVLSDA